MRKEELIDRGGVAFLPDDVDFGDAADAAAAAAAANEAADMAANDAAASIAAFCC